LDGEKLSRPPLRAFRTDSKSAPARPLLPPASGRTAPQAQGGDRRSDRVEAEAAFLLARVTETPDATLAELREALWRERLPGRGQHALESFDRRRITLKKRRRMPPSRSAPT
jgi:hypothetical protein